MVWNREFKRICIAFIGQSKGLYAVPGTITTSLFIIPNRWLLGVQKCHIVTNHGFSDWATVDIDSGINSMWYRLSRRGNDFIFGFSLDGTLFKQMRIFHLLKCEGKINFGLLACSPGQSTFDAVFTDMRMDRCLWEKHS